MFFPLSDDDREITSPVYVTYVLLAVNIAVFVYQVYHPEFTYGWSMVPKEITTGVDLVETVIVRGPEGEQVAIPQSPGPPIIFLTLLTSMFMHGGYAHIIGNMLYLYIFGDNVEHRFGHLPFLIFYLLAGLAGSIAQIILDPNGVIPNLGASGAISGIMGAYLVLFPRNRVNVIFLYAIISMPAVAVLGVWIVGQLFSTYGSIMANTGAYGGVAYAAHVAGFATGFVAALVWRPAIKREPDSVLRRQYERDPRSHRLW
jgi:membrane associated rhomboid family serine protease